MFSLLLFVIPTVVIFCIEQKYPESKKLIYFKIFMSCLKIALIVFGILPVPLIQKDIITIAEDLVTLFSLIRSLAINMKKIDKLK